MGLEGAAQHLIGLLPGGPVGRLGVLHQHGPGQLLPPEGELHAGHELGILADQPVLLHHILDDLGRHGFQLHRKGPEDQGDDCARVFQLLAEGRVQHGPGIFQQIVLGLGADFVIVILFRQIECIGCVDAVTHIGQGLGRFQADNQLIAAVPGRQDLLGGGSLCYLVNDLTHLLGKGFNGQTFILEL